jgi:tetratricopeptide (TPR) repeat protein
MHDYEGAFGRAFRKTCQHLARIEADHSAAPEHLAELLALARPERERALASSSRFHSYVLATHAMKRSERECLRAPARARELARLARSVVGHIDPRTCGGPEAVNDLHAGALAAEGNALRVCGNFRGALEAFAGARAIQRRGGVDPDLSPTIDLLESSLRRDLWQFGWALALLDRASEAFLSLEEPYRVAQTTINRANVYIVKGDWTRATALLRSAIDSDLDFEFALAARHNLADTLVKAGCAREAAQVFAATRSLYDLCTDTVMTSRRLWLEGLIARELGEDLQHANDLLEQATDNLMVLGYAWDAGLAELDLKTTRKRQADSTRRAERRGPWG